MERDTPEPLWREVVGDTEPWRRGRTFLIVFAALQLLGEFWFTGTALLRGSIEAALGFGLGALVFWLTFYFIWIGVHWVRWLSGGLSMLLGFTKLIWSVRDGSVVFAVDGTISFALGAYLALAPAVYFFAVRQKDHIRWKEAVVVAAVFLMLLVSFCAAIFGLGIYKAQLDAQGREFASRAFERIFVDGDSHFLRARATERLMRLEGWDNLSWFMSDRYMRVGVARELTPPTGRMYLACRFPFSLVSSGNMSCGAVSSQGRVRLHISVVNAGDGWQIDAVWWRYDT